MKKNKKIIFSKEQKLLRRRIIDVSYKNKLSHIGSCLSSIDLINGVYKYKKINDKFVLSNGHAGIALYAVLEKYNFIKDLETINKLHIHPDRNENIGIDVSTGSLGQGLPIAVGMSLANINRTIYCMISDGEMTEGSIWESLRLISDKKIFNLKIILNANGWSAYDKVNLRRLLKRVKAFGFQVKDINGHDPKEIKIALLTKVKTKPLFIFAYTTVEQLPFLKGMDAHYYFMNDEDYKLSIKFLQ